MVIGLRNCLLCTIIADSVLFLVATALFDDNDGNSDDSVIEMATK